MTQEAREIAVAIDDEYAGEIDGEVLRRTAVAVLDREGIGPAELSIVVTGDETLRDLNRTYRGVDSATDVLSFSAREGDPPPGDLPPDLAAEIGRNLGDLVISLPRAAHQARLYGHSLTAEMQLLVVHGVLHLLGYDHDSDDGTATMWRVQDGILTDLVPEDLTRRIHDVPRPE